MYVLIAVHCNTLYVLVCKAALLTVLCKVQQCYMVVSHWPQLYMIMSLIIRTCVTQFCWYYQSFLPHMLQMLDLNTEHSLTWI